MVWAEAQESQALLDGCVVKSVVIGGQVVDLKAGRSCWAV
jgi:hypothetical protein